MLKARKLKFMLNFQRQSDGFSMSLLSSSVTARARWCLFGVMNVYQRRGLNSNHPMKGWLGSVVPEFCL